MSDTQNVKLGVCRVILGGVDLGYTKGGVEVEVSTDTHKVTVDQFGQSEINEYIMKRSLKVKVPLAETTLENMVRVFPGATLVDMGVKEVDTVTPTVVNPALAQTDTITIDGVACAFTSDATPTVAEICAGLIAAVNAAGVDMVATGTNTVVLTSRISGKDHTIAVSANLANVNTTPPVVGKKRVDVTNGIGTDLLSIAQELVLHPKGKADLDKSEDFIIPKASTAGALQFAYKFDDERIFNVEFMGYPTSGTNILFKFGDPLAV